MIINTEKISVAVPWGLSHFIPLNGFHPLYRALFDQHPGTTTLLAYDNVKLFNVLQNNRRLRGDILRLMRRQNLFLGVFIKDRISREYLYFYGKSNKVLTQLIPGQLEFFHTAPFPTLERPFVFHCEMFSSIFTPFYQHTARQPNSWGTLRDYYRKIFSHPLCLGIFSHIPETIKNFSSFFQMEEIDRKLHHSKIGLSAHAIPAQLPPSTKRLTDPKFLFFNSAHHNPKNFWPRGGHIVLRFWKEFRARQKSGCLYLRCVRPEDKDLSAHGVDLMFLRQEEGKSIFWIENYLSNNEMNALISTAHFFLLPSVWLHSASIMQAMALGALPVVTDTVGTSCYVVDGKNGIVLKGVVSNNESVHPDTGVLFDVYRQNEILDKELVRQLALRIFAVLDAPHVYEKMRLDAIVSFRNNFSGEAFSLDFWSTVRDLYTEKVPAELQGRDMHERLDLGECFLNESDWDRVFESCSQPVLKLNSGFSSIYELGGAFIRVNTCGMVGKPKKGLHDWSVFTKGLDLRPCSLAYTTTLKEAVAGMFESASGQNKRVALLKVFFRKSVKKIIRLFEHRARIGRG